MEAYSSTKLNKQVLANAVSNAAYLSEGADVIDASQGSAAMIGTGAKYAFTLFKPSAKNYTSGMKDSDLADVGVSSIDLEVGRTYSHIKCADIDKANVNWEGIVSDMAVEMMNTRVEQVVKEDVLQMPTIVAGGVSDLLKTSAQLASLKKGKQIGFADGLIIGDIAASGTTLLPCTAPGAMDVDAVKVWNISALHAMNLPKSTALATTVTASIATDGVVTSTGLVAGNIYVFKKGNEYYTVVADSATSGKTRKPSAAVTGATGVNSDCACMIVRTDKAQAYKDFGAWLDADTKVTVEGVTVALTKKFGNLSDKEYLYELANASGIADASKSRVVWYPTSLAGFVVKG